MLSNLQILSQFAMAMNRMSFSMMALGLGQSLFPKVEVNDLAPALSAARVASYNMSAMFVCWSLTSLCHSNGHIETMPAREINPFTALTRIRS